MREKQSYNSNHETTENSHETTEIHHFDNQITRSNSITLKFVGNYNQDKNIKLGSSKYKTTKRKYGIETQNTFQNKQKKTLKPSIPHLHK